jgi:hypothetical protein
MRFFVACVLLVGAVSNATSFSCECSPESAVATDLAWITMTPGCYNSPAALSISTGTLTLDGSGVYVFKTAAAFSTAAATAVSLVNGASPSRGDYRKHHCITASISLLHLLSPS